MTPYVYSPLDLNEDNIRLLRIERGYRSDPIKCWLFESPKKGIEYKALSYTWGESGPKGIIEIEGHQFDVSENLYSALKEIRSQHHDVIVWVDAICINQNKANEKGHQVKQMGTIYKSAVEVLIWLGSSDHGIISLMDSINWIHHSAAREKSKGIEKWPDLCARFTKQRFLEIGWGAYPTQKKTLQQLLGHRWFHRVWILQEVANAREAVIMCGSESCPAKTFAQMPASMELELQADGHVQAVLDIMPGYRTATWWTTRRCLHFLLWKFAESEAGNPVDKIYALLGISEDANNHQMFYPNYEKDETRVLQDTLSFLLFKQVLWMTAMPFRSSGSKSCDTL